MAERDDQEYETNALEMTDEDFLKADPASFEADDSSVSDDPDDQTAQDTDPTPPDTGEDDDPGEEANADDDQDKSDDPNNDPADHYPDTKEASAAESARREALTDEERAAEDAEENSSDDPDDKDSTKKEAKSAGEELTDTQYAEVGKQIMSEFKANGTTIKPKSAEDAIKLMQMGANYHKKMSGLKPSLKTLKLLENNDLLDPEKLNFLIDLNQRKPEAITKLLKDSKMDPMDIDVEAEDSYTPNQRTVSDTELLLDEVLDTIKDNPTYDRTLNVLGNDWDDTSRNAIAKDPEIIRTINGHMENGIFDQVAETVAYERSLGKLSGVSDFEAYQRVGTYMNESGLFKSTKSPSNSTVPPAAAEPNRQDQQPRGNANDEQARRKRKQAASPSRQRKAPAPDNDNFNPLAMSDEEYIKLNKLSL